MKIVASFITLSMIALTMFSCQNEPSDIVPADIQKSEIVSPDRRQVIYGRYKMIAQGHAVCLEPYNIICFIIPLRVGSEKPIVEKVSSDALGTTYNILEADKIEFPTQK